jgi:hypothetical protein
MQVVVATALDFFVRIGVNLVVAVLFPGAVLGGGWGFWNPPTFNFTTAFAGSDTALE